jgi:exopolysaccharide biosynthesis polyprenyl glycosylphosphotransferase
MTRMQLIDLRAVRRLHVLTDAVLVSVGWLLAYAFRYALNDVLGYPINSFYWYLRALPLVVLPWIASCWVFGIYGRTRISTPTHQIQSLLRSVALGLLVVSSISFFFKELQFGRVVVLACACINLVFQGASRAVFHRIQERLRRSGAHDISALIVGTGITAIRLLQKLQDHPETGYEIAGFLDDSYEEGCKDVANRPVLGKIDQLRDVAISQNASEVFIADPSLGHTRMLSLVLDCEDLGITFRVVTNLFEVLTAGTPIDLVDDLPLVRLGREQVPAFYEPLKRAFDVAGALVGLLLTAPLLLWCAMRTMQTSPGPAFIAQDRIGHAGEPFRLYKFRTMWNDVDRYSVAPRDVSDPRVTEYGRWLRGTSIDELPQLVNVLKGDMSLVGPRPEMPFIAETYDDWQRRRLSVKPGITGLWQILGRKDLPMHENLQYDFYYIRNRSLSLDLSILLRTIGAVLSRKGAF